MKPFRTVCAALMAVLSLCLAAPASDLRDLSDLAKIERALTSGIGDSHDVKPAIVREVKTIRTVLQSVPASQRVKALRRLADKTKWGTPERATAYYVCAWYDVNYERCRDYLLNCFFWFDRGLHGRNRMTPFCWAEDTVLHLYILYERNHDFRLLHDLVTGHSDGCGSEALGYVRVDALAKHPRGMLHVAGMSRDGRAIGLDCLKHGLSETEVDDEAFRKAYSVFPVYLRRVASDTNDPLSELARDLLRDAQKRG